jgi:hypothetical protein
MKKLIATTALIATAFTAVPAQANDSAERLLTAIGTAIIFQEVYKDRTDKVGRVVDVFGSKENPLNERHRPGYASGLRDFNKVCHSEVIRHGNYAEVVESNCYGQVLSTRIIRR